VTLIPAKCVGDAEIRDTDYVSAAASGTETAVLGEVSLPFALGNYEGVINGLVTEHTARVVLGIHWLVEHCAVWEFNRSRVKIGGTYHELRCRPCTGHENANALSGRSCRLPNSACPTAKQDTHDYRGSSQNTESSSSGLIGGSADCSQIVRPGVIQSITHDTRTSTTDKMETGDNADGAIGNVPSWSHDGLCAAQRVDPDVGFVIRQMEGNKVKPEWEEVALSSRSVKILWNQWLRLAIQDGLLKRRFEAADGASVHWEVVWPASMKDELLQVAHAGMTGGHLGRRKTAAAIQIRAYWPTWSSDLDSFLRQCEPRVRYHRENVKLQAKLHPFPAGESWEKESRGTTDVSVRSIQKKSVDADALVRQHWGMAREQRKATNDIRTHEENFSVGDWVVKST